jgi:hypothetical protein
MRSFLVLVSFAVLATVRTDLFGCVSSETVAHCAASWLCGMLLTLERSFVSWTVGVVSTTQDDSARLPLTVKLLTLQVPMTERHPRPLMFLLHTWCHRRPCSQAFSQRKHSYNEPPQQSAFLAMAARSPLASPLLEP